MENLNTVKVPYQNIFIIYGEGDIEKEKFSNFSRTVECTGFENLKETVANELYMFYSRKQDSKKNMLVFIANCKETCSAILKEIENHASNVDDILSDEKKNKERLSDIFREEYGGIL